MRPPCIVEQQVTVNKYKIQGFAGQCFCDVASSCRPQQNLLSSSRKVPRNFFGPILKKSWTLRSECSRTS